MPHGGHRPAQLFEKPGLRTDILVRPSSQRNEIVDEPSYLYSRFEDFFEHVWFDRCTKVDPRHFRSKGWGQLLDLDILVLRFRGVWHSERQLWASSTKAHSITPVC